MAREVRSVDVDVPVRTAYDQWTQFEDFPQFMEGVTDVQQVDDRTLRWKASIAGKDREWTSRIADQIPDRCITWSGFGDVANSGTVLFEPLEAARTRVTVAIDYQPEGPAERFAETAGVVGLRVKGDLERYKTFIEDRGVATGAWRGEIEDGLTVPSTR